MGSAVSGERAGAAWCRRRAERAGGGDRGGGSKRAGDGRHSIRGGAGTLGQCSLSFPPNGNWAEVVGQVGNLRRGGNPPEPLAKRPAPAPVADRKSGGQGK